MPNTLVVQDVVCSEAHYKLDTGQLKWWGPNRHIYLTINQMDITDCESRYSTISLKMQQMIFLHKSKVDSLKKLDFKCVVQFVCLFVLVDANF